MNTYQNCLGLLPRTLLPLLQRMAKSGTPKQAKHAIRCIDAMCRNKDAIFKQLYEVEDLTCVFYL